MTRSALSAHPVITLTPARGHVSSLPPSSGPRRAPSRHLQGRTASTCAALLHSTGAGRADEILPAVPPTSSKVQPQMRETWFWTAQAVPVPPFPRAKPPPTSKSPTEEILDKLASLPPSALSEGGISMDLSSTRREAHRPMGG